MPDEPSLGELGRLIQLLRSDIRDDMAQINARLDRMVSADVYAVERASMVAEIDGLKKSLEGVKTERKADADRVAATRRWLIASVVIPMIGMMLPYILIVKGAAGS